MPNDLTDFPARAGVNRTTLSPSSSVGMISPRERG